MLELNCPNYFWRANNVIVVVTAKMIYMWWSMAPARLVLSYKSFVYFGSAMNSVGQFQVLHRAK